MDIEPAAVSLCAHDPHSSQAPPLPISRKLTEISFFFPTF